MTLDNESAPVSVARAEAVEIQWMRELLAFLEAGGEIGLRSAAGVLSVRAELPGDERAEGLLTCLPVPHGELEEYPLADRPAFALLGHVRGTIERLGDLDARLRPADAVFSGPPR